MIQAINFLLEANVCLMAVLLLYRFSLSRETSFAAMRFFLIIGVLISITVPFLDFSASAEQMNVPVIGDLLPSNWLPEVVISSNSFHATETNTWTIWKVGKYIYLGGVALFGAMFLYQITFMILTIVRSKPYKQNGVFVAESTQTTAAFSFFNFVFIGSSEALTAQEKLQIVQHETVHAKKFHSFDILLASLLEVIFWFNPLIRLFRKNFVQIHEFEADARAVENQDVDRYCNLLARVALQTAGIRLGNHFNNSLTIKRIQMIRKLKTNIKWWKIAAPASVIIAITLLFACSEQLATSPTEGLNLPEEAKRNFEAFKQAYPGETFIVEYDDFADEKLAKLDAQFGNPKHQELFTITEEGKQRTFSMLVYRMTGVTKNTPISPSDEIHEVVEVMPEYEGGHAAMVEYLSNNLLYPKAAREKGLEGTCFVSFVVEKDGSISSVQLKRGFDEACDAESVKIVSAMPAWRPGGHNGQVVRTRWLLPIKYKL